MKCLEAVVVGVYLGGSSGGKMKARRRRVVPIFASAVIVASSLVATGPASATAVGSASSSSRSSLGWTPPATVNRTSVGSTPRAAWAPTVRQNSGTSSTAANPGTDAVAAGALGAQPAGAGSAAAGAGLGVQASYGLETFGLNTIDGLQAQVNLANGNLVVHSTDLKINAPGLTLRLDRFYNSKASGVGAFGTHAVLSTGRDVGLQVGASSVTFTGPSGFTAVFAGTGPTYSTPPGINATLVKNTDGTFALTYHRGGEKLTFTSGGYLSKDADRNGNTIRLAYNSDNTLASLTDAAGRVTTFQYANGLINYYTDPAQRRTTYTYTGTNLTLTHDPAGHLTRYTYDSSNRLTRIQTGAGTYTDFGYDTSNRVTSVKRYLVTNSLTGGSVTTTFAYPNSTTTTETDPAAHTTTYTLDSSGRVTAVKNALGKTKSQTWTANSDVQTAIDATGSTPSAGNTTRFSYDGNNNLTAVSTPTGAGAAAQYANSTSPACASSDASHPYLAKCTEDGQGNQASASYDTAGNLTQSNDSTAGTNSGVTQTYTHQGDAGVACGAKPGQVCSATSGNGNKTSYSYDSNGDLTKVTPPAPGVAVSYGYDSLSRLTSVITGNGVNVTYSYDYCDQRIRTLYSMGGEVNYSYDADGDLTSLQDSVGGTESYRYDGLDRETSLTLPGASTSVSVTYNTAGDVATYTDPAGTITYGYDAGNELTALAEPGGSCTGTVSRCTTFGYDANGDLSSTTFPGATVQSTTRDKSGRAIEIRAVHGTTVLSDLAYSYTKSSKDTALVQSRTDKLGVGGPANSVITYSYDTLDRLTAAVERTSAGTTNAAWSYAYDKDGNRTANTATLSGTTTTTSQGYNAVDELTSLNGSTSGLSYDKDGNQLTNPGNSSIGVAAVTATTVNGRDQNIAANLNGAPTSASYLGETEATLTSANNGSITTAFANTLLGLASETAAGSTVSFARTPGGRLIAADLGTSSAYYLTDTIGSTVGIVNTAGTKIAAYAYDPYGRTRTATGSFAASNAIRYAGGLFDTTTGATKFGARYYDPNTGRFTQPDPSGQETNPYAYTADNPINDTDLTGRHTASLFAVPPLLEADTLVTSTAAESAAAGSVAAGPLGVAAVVLTVVTAVAVTDLLSDYF